jgi:hypothetical protein
MKDKDFILASEILGARNKRAYNDTPVHEIIYKTDKEELIKSFMLGLIFGGTLIIGLIKLT